MKSVFNLIANLLLTGSLFFSGCGSAHTPTDGNANEEAQRQRRAKPQNESSFWNNLPADFENVQNDPLRKRILADYGAAYVGCSTSIMVPRQVLFANASELNAWQSMLNSKQVNLGGTSITLQAAAMDDLILARDEAVANKLSIRPRGSNAAKRDYEETVRLWLSRVNPGLRHWLAAGKIEPETAKRINALAPAEQVPEILQLEAKGIYFSTGFDKSILYSVAAPGTSQHLTLLALDVREFADSRVRAILARHGWFQTVQSDLPHFTYLGCKEEDLPSRGLRRVESGGHIFWIPDIQ